MSRLDPETVLRLVRTAAELLDGSTDPSAAMHAVGELLVPAAGEDVTVYVVDSDGRLRPLEVDRASDAPVPPGVGPTDRSVPPDAVHPAAVACREGAVARVGAEETAGGAERIRTDGAEPGARYREIALPLRRDGEAVGSIHIDVGPDGEPLTADDLEGLEYLTRQLARSLELLRRDREVADARRAKADFLAVMSHELRTPLTAIVGYADLIDAGISGPVSSRQRQQLERIKESAWELLDLIDGILGYARFEGARTELRTEVVDPEAVLEDALGPLRPGIREKGLELRVSVAPGLPPLRTGPRKLTELLGQILSNAVKFTDEGGVSVEVTAERDWIVFEVRDTGSGIARAHQERVFEPFWQSERAETRTKGGTGMGLSLARRIADLLSAELDLESSLGRGTAVTLRLPRDGPHPTFP